jgi:quinol monooxygenase YgiN
MPEHPILTAVKSQVKDVNLPFMMAVHVTIKPGTSAPFEVAFTECIKLTRKETGCIAYDLNRCCEEPTKYINYERWASVAALDAHLNAPHTVKLLTTLAPYLDGSPVIKVYAFAGE